MRVLVETNKHVPRKQLLSFIQRTLEGDSITDESVNEIPGLNAVIDEVIVE